MVNAIICCAKEVRALIVLDIECNLSCKFVKNCRIIGLDIGQKKQIMSEVCMIKKKGLIVLFTGEVIRKDLSVK